MILNNYIYIYIQFVYYETCIFFVVNQNFILKKNVDILGGGKALQKFADKGGGV